MPEIIPVASFRIIFFANLDFHFYFETTDIGFIHFEDQGIGCDHSINQNCCGPFQSQHEHS
jgi:hypothetical protein